VSPVEPPVATVLWLARPELVLALDERLGEPTDSYVNGAQTWIEANGPGEAMLEWRLHPVAGFERPAGLGTYELWEHVIDALEAGDDPQSLALGDEERSLSSLWDGLECFPAFGDSIEPGVLSATTAEVLGIPPDRTGIVDHQAIGDRWEQARGNVSIVSLLLEQLDRPPDLA